MFELLDKRPGLVIGIAVLVGILVGLVWALS